MEILNCIILHREKYFSLFLGKSKEKQQQKTMLSKVSNILLRILKSEISCIDYYR